MAAAVRVLRDADELLEPVVAKTVATLTLAPEDAAAAGLALRYAAEIDAAADKAEALDRLGPKLLSVLESLGATPRSRTAGKPSAAPARLEALRAARRS